MCGSSFTVNYGAGNGNGLCGGLLAGDADGDDHDRCGNTLWPERDIIDPWRHVSSSMPFISGRSDAAWMVSGKLFSDAYFRERGITFIS